MSVRKISMIVFSVVIIWTVDFFVFVAMDLYWTLIIRYVIVSFMFSFVLDDSVENNY